MREKREFGGQEKELGESETVRGEKNNRVKY